MNKDIFAPDGYDIYFRKMNLDDIDCFINWRNSDEVRKNFLYRELFTRESQELWIKTMLDTGKAVQFIIHEKNGDKPIGSVYIRDIDKVHSKGEYGVLIGEAGARGRGIGTQAAEIAIKYAFDCLKLHRLYLRALVNNKPAIRSYEKAGFLNEGVLKDDAFIDGAYTDVVWLGIINKNAAKGNK